MDDMFQTTQATQPTFREHIMQQHGLTAKEADAVELACDGLAPEEIGELLEVTTAAIECRLYRVRIKCGFQSFGQLVSFFAFDRRRKWRFTHEARVQAAHPDMDAWLAKGAA